MHDGGHMRSWCLVGVRMNLTAYLSHRPRYHAGLSKRERLAQVQGKHSWFSGKRRRWRRRTYGLRYHAGGWLFERRRTARSCLRRQWRKQARREAKRWIQEQSCCGGYSD